MIEKELREIKKRFRADKNNILSVRGCLVNSNKEIVSSFNQPIATCTNEETEKFLSILKKVLSGSLGTNLLNLEFSNYEVMGGEKHSLLMTMKNSCLKDENALNSFYEKVIQNIDIEGNFAILLATDKYDIFNYSSEGQKEEDSSEVFTYFICGICPVKPLNSGLCFKEIDNSFRSIDAHLMLGNPEVGFMFPAFDNRTSNIYNTLFYTKDITNIHPEFIETVFGSEIPMAPAEQKENFKDCIKETLENDCDYETLSSVHQQISEIVKEHKESKTDEPLTLSKKALKNILEFCGVENEKTEKFEENFDKQFGKNAEISPNSIVNIKKFELKTPDVSINVNPDRKELISTQIINGVRYIMIKANEGVEVNGIDININ